jgi:hypothetical protein
VYCFTKDQVLKFAVQTITEFLFEHELTVYICVFDKESYTFSQKLFNDIRAFIDEDYVVGHGEEYYDAYCAEDERSDRDSSRFLASATMRRTSNRSDAPRPEPSRAEPSEPKAKGSTLKDYLGELDVSFQEMLFSLIDQSGMTDVECYKRANVDKRTFSKIKSNKDYRPSKQTVIAFAISLRLDLDETQALLATVGFTLSRSSVFDKIIRYFILNGNYDIFEINEALFEFDQQLLGV